MAGYLSQGDRESAAWVRVRVLQKATPSRRSRPASRGSVSRFGQDTVGNTVGDTARYTVENNTFGYKDKSLSEEERKEEKPTRGPHAHLYTLSGRRLFFPQLIERKNFQ